MNNTIKLTDYVQVLDAIALLAMFFSRFDEEDLRMLLRSDCGTLEDVRDAINRVVESFQSVRGYN